MKLKTLLIGISVLLVLTLLPLSAAQPGDPPPPAGNCPCYSPGEVISVGSWWQSGFYWTVTDTYIGGCQIEQEWLRNGQFYAADIYDGGCICSCGGISPATPALTADDR